MDGRLRRFQPGEVIVIREVLGDKVWTVRPVTVIEDTDRQLVAYLAPGTLIDYPVDVVHGEKCFSMWLTGEWELHKMPFSAPGILRIAPRGQPFEVFAPLTEEGGITSWYVNFQRPLMRTRLGFDTMDEVLDLIVAADFSSWTRKDEDELLLAVEMGVYDEGEAERIRNACGAVEESLKCGVVPCGSADGVIGYPQPLVRLGEVLVASVKHAPAALRHVPYHSGAHLLGLAPTAGYESRPGVPDRRECAVLVKRQATEPVRLCKPVPRDQ